ncbi:MAG: MASE1 domain-containing protein [Candidatus Krumholzibacteria bacterium]|nr:MASE1 domain-containing protein [Candidatus Krumholzibacteria bacterium]
MTGEATRFLNRFDSEPVTQSEPLSSLLRFPTYARRLPEIFLLAIVYYFTARLGQAFAIPPGNVTPVWIPSGICLAVILLRGYALWPGIFLGAFAGNVWAYIDFQSSDIIVRSLLTGTANGVGDVLCAVGGAYLIRRLTGTSYPFHHASHVAIFVGYGVVAGSLVSALFGVISLCAAGFLPWDKCSNTLLTWTVGDGVGVLAVAPFLIALFAHANDFRTSRTAQVILYYAALVLVAALAMGLMPPVAGVGLPIFSLAPLLIGAAFKFNQRIVFFAVFIVAMLTVTAGYLHVGPFQGQEQNTALMNMQWFLALMSMTLLTVSAIVHERGIIGIRLRAAHDELEGRVRERTAELQESNRNLEHEMLQRHEAEESRAEMEGQLRQAQKIEAIGTLAGGIAHDFNNILMAMMGFTDMALEDAPKGSAQESHLKESLRSQLRARDLVKRILLFARQDEADVGPVSLREVVDDTIKIIRGSLPSTIDIRTRLEGQPAVEADASQIGQVVLNLCTNAFHAMEKQGGLLQVELSEVNLTEPLAGYSMTAPAGAYALLSVSDNGVGISKEVMGFVFDPFFTTMPPDKGTGMGLSVVLGVVRSAAGTICITSEPDEGTRIDVYLPLSDRKAVAPLPEEVVPANGSERILFVDDEPTLVNLALKALKAKGYTVTGFTNSSRALDHFKESPSAYDLVITDLTMPFMTGDELVQEITAIRQDIPVILCSGYSDRIGPEDLACLNLAKALSKPFSIGELAVAVREVLDTY